MKMRLDDTLVQTNTVLRCCVETLMDRAADHPDREVDDGDTIQCRVVPAHKLVLFNGFWRWLDPAEAEARETQRLWDENHPSVRRPVHG